MGSKKKEKKKGTFQQLLIFSEEDLVGSYCKFEEKSVLIILGNFLACYYGMPEGLKKLRFVILRSYLLELFISKVFLCELVVVVGF